MFDLHAYAGEITALLKDIKPLTVSDLDQAFILIQTEFRDEVQQLITHGEEWQFGAS